MASILHRWAVANIKKSYVNVLVTVVPSVLTFCVSNRNRPEVLALLVPVTVVTAFAGFKLYDKATFDQDLRWRGDKGRIETFEERFGRKLSIEDMQTVPSGVGSFSLTDALNTLSLSTTLFAASSHTSTATRARTPWDDTGCGICRTRIAHSPEVLALLVPVTVMTAFAGFKLYDKATFDQDLRWRGDKGRIETFEERFGRKLTIEDMQTVPVWKARGTQ
ncbi:hypothetical protein M427DRAFT_26928 [Gonapodya prolifera JEL478]|uniref:Uncharacterized protein n=1 Tax=Gonapodya prolifera (strain JEL478) TaxID=1344416 RepID=A0A139B030_GONPJ|nr:hypothetical protein M427DRAFT_26928 [Gonapodya prolifera JEL478]|eukprot:KXS22352.1 hypothetical protein M427DRAFT_26928 [Gonapodya prolifera JEL478]